MKCDALRDWVLKCDSVQVRAWPKKMVRHVKRCRPCRHFTRSILRLEDAWRHQQLPKSAKKPSAAYLEQIRELETAPAQSATASQPKRKHGVLLFRLLPLGGAAAMLRSRRVIIFSDYRRQTHAPSDVVDRLIVEPRYDHADGRTKAFTRRA